MRKQALLLGLVGLVALFLGTVASVVLTGDAPDGSGASSIPADRDPRIDADDRAAGSTRSAQNAGEDPRQRTGTPGPSTSGSARAEGDARTVDRGVRPADARRPRVTPIRPEITTRRLQLVTADGLSRAVTSGAWSLESGVAVATAGAGKIDAALTVPTYYAEIERLTIRGGLDVSSDHNFRVQAGPVSLIFNWEVRDENHYRIGTKRSESGPPALIPGQEHEIVLEQRDEFVELTVDGVELWKVKGTLHGPVTVYPALGSKIHVREIAIRGRAVPEVEITGPAYPLQ